MENLGIDIKLLVAQLINFALFFYIFKKFMAKPFQTFLKNEGIKDEDKEKALNLAKVKGDEIVKKEEDFKKEMKKQTSQILNEAKEEAKKMKETLLTQTKVEMEQFKAHTKKQIEMEQIQSKKEVDKKVAELASKTIDSLLKSYLTEDVSRQITDKMLRSLPEELARYEN